jgi:hypothetical protein
VPNKNGGTKPPLKSNPKRQDHRRIFRFSADDLPLFETISKSIEEKELD